MNRKKIIMLLFSLLLTNHMILMADFWSDVNPINIGKKIKEGVKGYGAGQQALKQVEAQQKIMELLANNPGASACAEQLEQIAAINKETNAILQSGVELAKDTISIGSVYAALCTTLTLGGYGYRFYKWMRPSEEEIDAKEMQRERNRDELKIYITRDAIGCLQNNSPDRVNRCNKVFASYSRLLGANALADLRKSVNNQTP